MALQPPTIDRCCSILSPVECIDTPVTTWRPHRASIGLNGVSALLPIACASRVGSRGCDARLGNCGLNRAADAVSLRNHIPPFRMGRRLIASGLPPVAGMTLAPRIAFRSHEVMTSFRAGPERSDSGLFIVLRAGHLHLALPADLS